MSLSDIWAFSLPFIARNTLCGTIVCHWTHSKIVLVTNYDVQYTYLGGHICLSGYLRPEARGSVVDATRMNNGTMCGVNKVKKILLHSIYVCIWVSVYVSACAWEREKKRERMTSKMAVWENPELTSSHGHTESTLDRVPSGERERRRET